MSDNYIAKEEILSFVEEMEKRTHGDDLITKTVLATTKCVKDFVMYMPPEDVQPVVQWTPCSERLPEKYGNYLVTDIKTIDIDIFTHSGNGTPMWFLSDNVTAWMPLPEGYHGEGEQDGKIT